MVKKKATLSKTVKKMAKRATATEYDPPESVILIVRSDGVIMYNERGYLDLDVAEELES